MAGGSGGANEVIECKLYLGKEAASVCVEIIF